MQSKKQPLSFAIIGQYSSGKSTLAGQLLVQSSQISSEIFSKAEKEATPDTQPKKYALLVQKSKNERAALASFDCAVLKLETVTMSLTMIDTPGHKNFVDNMLPGLSQADAAVVVVSAAGTEFE